MSRYLPAIVLALALLFGLSLLLHRSSPGPSPASSSAMSAPATSTGATEASSTLVLPNLTFPDLQGHPQNLTAFRGHPVFLNMWATWCPPCRAEIPDLEELYAVNHAKGFVVIGVDQGQDATPVSSFVTSYSVNYPIVLDQHQTLSQLAGVNGLPSTLVYNRKGKLVDEVTGMMTPQAMQLEFQKAESN